MKSRFYAATFAIALGLSHLAFMPAAHAACPTPPTGTDDLIIRFPAAQGIYTGPQSAMAINLTNPSPTDNGVLIFDPTDKSLKLCIDDNWLTLLDSSFNVAAAGAAGEVQFSDGAGGFLADNQLVWDNTNKRFGVGTAAPESSLDIKVPNVAGTIPRVMLTTTSSTSARYPTFIARNYAGNTGGHPGYRLVNSAGTFESPEALVNNVLPLGPKTIGVLDFHGQVSPTNAPRLVRIRAFMDGNYTPNSAPTGLSFFTSNNGVVGATNFDVERMRITSLGNVGIGTETPASRLHVAGGITLGDDTADCPGDANIKLGTMRFNGGALQICQGTDWTNIGSGSGAVGVAGDVQFSDGAGSFVADNQFNFNNTSKQLTVGPAVSPDLLTTDRLIFSVEGNSVGLAGVSTGTGAGHRPVFKGTRARGTLLAPAAVNLNDDILTFLAAAYDGTEVQPTAGVFFRADAAATAGVAPIRISFVTSQTTGAARTERMTIKPDGKVGIGTISPQAMLDVAQRIRSQGQGDTTGMTGQGLEMFYNDTTNNGTVQAFDRSANEFLPLRLSASVVELRSGIKLANDTAACPGAGNVKLGTLRFNSGALQICQGSDWTNIGTGSGAVGAAGNIQFSNGTGSFAASPDLFWGDIDGGANQRLNILKANDNAALVLRTVSDNAGHSASLSAQRARGTPTAMTSVAANDTAARFGGEAHNGSTMCHIGRMRVAVDTAAPSKVTGRLVFETSGAATTCGNTTERMRITSEGLVGIGTTNPQAQLDVSGTIALLGMKSSGQVDGDNYINIQGETNRHQWLRFRRGGVGTFGSAGTVYSNFDGSHYFVENNAGIFRIRFSNESNAQPSSASATTFFVIRNNGYTGIGNSTPASRLHVAGGVQLGDDTDLCPGDANIKLGTLRFNGGALQICQGTAWANVGVSGSGAAGAAGEVQLSNGAGAFTADDKLKMANETLDVVSRVRVGPSYGNNYGAQVSGTTAGLGVFGTNLYVNRTSLGFRTSGTHVNYGYAAMTTGWGHIRFYTNAGATTADEVVTPVTRMIIGAAGNVGIGTETPTAKLDVSGTARATMFEPRGQLEAEGIGMTLNSQAGTSFNLRANPFDGITNNIRWRASNTGFGTLQWIFSGADAVDQSISIHPSQRAIKAASALGFHVGPTIGTTTEAMRIISNGYVGLGTITPQTKLHVEGAIVSTANNAIDSRIIDWRVSNTAYTTASCGAFTFSYMQDGGTYTIAVKGTTAGTCSFTHSGLTFRLPPGHTSTLAGTQTVYTFLRAGADVYVSWVPGY